MPSIAVAALRNQPLALAPEARAYWAAHVVSTPFLPDTPVSHRRNVLQLLRTGGTPTQLTCALFRGLAEHWVAEQQWLHGDDHVQLSWHSPERLAVPIGRSKASTVMPQRGRLLSPGALASMADPGVDRTAAVLELRFPIRALLVADGGAFRIHDNMVKGPHSLLAPYDWMLVGYPSHSECVCRIPMPWLFLQAVRYCFGPDVMTPLVVTQFPTAPALNQLHRTRQAALAVFLESVRFHDMQGHPFEALFHDWWHWAIATAALSPAEQIAATTCFDVLTAGMTHFPNLSPETQDLVDEQLSLLCEQLYYSVCGTGIIRSVNLWAYYILDECAVVRGQEYAWHTVRHVLLALQERLAADVALGPVPHDVIQLQREIAETIRRIDARELAPLKRWEETVRMPA